MSERLGAPYVSREEWDEMNAEFGRLECRLATARAENARLRKALKEIWIELPYVHSFGIARTHKRIQDIISEALAPATGEARGGDAAWIVKNEN